jgi:hypothetical protein
MSRGRYSSSTAIRTPRWSQRRIAPARGGPPSPGRGSNQQPSVPVSRGVTFPGSECVADSPVTGTTSCPTRAEAPARAPTNLRPWGPVRKPHPHAPAPRARHPRDAPPNHRLDRHEWPEDAADLAERGAAAAAGPGGGVAHPVRQGQARSPRPIRKPAADGSAGGHGVRGMPRGARWEYSIGGIAPGRAQQARGDVRGICG